MIEVNEDSDKHRHSLVTTDDADDADDADDDDDDDDYDACDDDVSAGQCFVESTSSETLHIQ